VYLSDGREIKEQVVLSPFPGMDPYIEDSAIWPDFHTTLFVEIKRGLNHILPPGYMAKIDRYIWIHEPSAQERIRLGKPDAYVAKDPAIVEKAQTSTTTLAAPATIVLPAVRQEGSRYLKVLDAKNHRVVTVVEIASPANKNPGPDREAYLMKRNEYFATGVNVVDIDLLRGGQRMPWGDQAPPRGDYYVMVCRAHEFPKAGIWSISVRDSLPVIPIPLDPGTKEPQLSLQECFNRAYEDSRLDAEIDYTQPPIPPLADIDAQWARELLSAAGRS
jgi:hypothetical protein